MVVIEARLWPDEAEMVMQALRATQATLRSLQTPPLDEPCPFGAHPSTDVTAETPAGESEPSPAPPPPATEPSSDVTAETSSEAKPSEPLVAPPSANLADALVAMAERQLVTLATTGGRGDQTPSPPAAARRELLVHLRHSDIREDTWSAELHDGTLIAGETLYRLACDSGLVVARTDDEGDPLDVGRRRRRVSAALLKALWIRDRGCRFPGCRQRVFVESHHIDHWARGGPTTKANLLLLCHRHHRAVHEDGFTVRRDDEGHPCFYDPDGRRIPDYPVAASPSDAAPVDDPRINLIRWDGRRADIRRAVEALTRRFLRGKSP